MSMLLDALVKNFSEQGLPIVILPNGPMLKKKKTDMDVFQEDFENRMTRTPVDTRVIPSPKPG